MANPRLILDSYSDLALANAYAASKPSYSQLCDEVAYILTTRLRGKSIEVSQITHRVKTLESLKDKAKRKNYVSPLDEVKDLAGVRVVCLYADDIPRIVTLVEKNFEVTESVNKTISEVDRFGYLARHFIVRLRPELSGARFEELKSLDCEIQVRTVLQDAWAIVDHHLRYKRESQIPSALSRSIHGLAAVLEMADQQFNTILNERDKYFSRLKDKRRTLRSLLGEELNRESLQAYLLKKFPSRAVSLSPQHFDAAVEHLDFRRYPTVGDLETPLAKTEKVRFEYKASDRSKFSVSQLAMAIACVDDDYRRQTFFGPRASKVIAKYRSQHRKVAHRRKKSSGMRVAAPKRVTVSERGTVAKRVPVTTPRFMLTKRAASSLTNRTAAKRARRR